MPSQSKSKKGDPIGPETRIPLAMLVEHYGDIPKLFRAQPELKRLIGVKQLRRWHDGLNAGYRKVPVVRPVLERLAQDFVPGYPKSPASGLDIHSLAMQLIQETASPSHIHEHAVDIYHKHNRPDDALKLIDYILGAKYVRQGWDWEDRCTVIGTMIHIAKRSSEPTNALCGVLENHVSPLLDDPTMPDRTAWHNWLIYIGGQLLELLGETPEAYRDQTRSTLIRELTHRLYWQMHVKHDAGSTLSDHNMVDFNVCSKSLIGPDRHRAGEALAWSQLLPSVVHENHQAAYQLRAIEYAIALDSPVELDEPILKLQEQLRRTIDQLHDLQKVPSHTFKVSPITFAAACVHYILANRYLASRHRELESEISITETLVGSWQQYARAKGKSAGHVLHRIHISPVFHELLKTTPMPNPILADFLHSNYLPNARSSGDSRLTQLLEFAATTLLRKTRSVSTRIVVTSNLP